MSAWVMDAEAFARAFNVTPDRLSAECRRLIDSHDFSCSLVDGAERDALLLQILEKIAGDTQIIAAEERRDVWERGWQEILRAFAGSGYALDTLVPQFLRPGQPIRLFQQYVRPHDPLFERHFCEVARHWLFETYLAPHARAVEFGCGTGVNLVALARMYPDKELAGYDFVPAPAQIIAALHRHHGFRITGGVFDMMAPDRSVRLGRDCAVYTFGSMEQLGGRIEPFLEYLLDQAPAVCLHFEPVYEFYDTTVLSDYLAAWFHRKRGYTSNLWTTLQALSSKGRLEIIAGWRTFFGSLYMEGYSVIVWRPRSTRA